MNMNAPVTRASVETFSQLQEEPSWMTALRLAAWDIFEKEAHTAPDLPRFPPVMRPASRSIPSHAWPRYLQHALEERGDEEGLIIQRDTTLLSKSITKEQSRRGVIFTDLQTALKRVPELVRRTFARQVRPDSVWRAFHTALWSGGTFLHVPAHVDITLPFHACYWLSEPRSGLFPHTLILAEKGSRVSFIDEFLSPDWAETALCGAATEIYVADHARVHYQRIENWGPGIHRFHFQEPHVSRTARLTTETMEGPRPVLSLEEAALRYPEVHR